MELHPLALHRSRRLPRGVVIVGMVGHMIRFGILIGPVGVTRRRVVYVRMPVLRGMPVTGMLVARMPVAGMPITGMEVS